MLQNVDNHSFMVIVYVLFSLYIRNNIKFRHLMKISAEMLLLFVNLLKKQVDKDGILYVTVEPLVDVSALVSISESCLQLCRLSTCFFTDGFHRRYTDKCRLTVLS